MASIFTKIVNGEIPSYKVAESDKFYAFLDIRPTQIGHTLVIPKGEIDYIFDIDDNLYQELFLFAKRVAEAIRKSIPCKRVGVVVLGMEVPHAHIHLIPINRESDLNLFAQKVELNPEEMVEIASKISANFKE